MPKASGTSSVPSSRKRLVWLHGEVKTPPFSKLARQEVGMLLRFLQEGEKLSMPQAEPVRAVGARCGALRVRDANHSWRIMYRTDPEVVLVLEVYSKKTRQIPDEIVQRCQQRLKQYDAIVKSGKSEKGPRK